MLLTWVALALTVPAMHLCLTHNALPFPEPSAAIATTPELQIRPVELQALRITINQMPTPPVLPPIEKMGIRAIFGSNAKMMPKSAFQYSHPKAWLALAAAEHAAAAFDAWSTRASLQTGHTRELDPLVRPFCHSAGLYPVLQVVPLASDFISRKMMRSSHPLLRQTWWLPQALTFSASLVSGTHNLSLVH